MAHSKTGVLKTVIFCAMPFIPIAALSCYALLFPMWFMDNEYPYWKHEKEILCSNEIDYDIISLGDSGCNGGFVPQIVSSKSFNFALSAATSVTMYYTMETYLKNHKPPKIVFIMFRNVHYQSQGAFWTRNLYFHYLTTSQEIDFFKSVAPLDKTGYAMENWFTDWLQYKFYFPAKYLPAMNNANFHKRKGDNDNLYTLSKENRGRYFGAGDFRESDSGLAADCYFENFKICAINEFYLRRLINLLKENDVTVIVEQLPFNETSFFKIAQNVKQDEKEFFENIQNEFGIASNSELFYYDDFCFLDGHHLNYRGAAKYSHYICDKYSDLLAPFRADKPARYEELLEYAKGIAKTENGLLETLNDDVFRLRVFQKSALPRDSLQNKILSEMKNYEFVNLPEMLGTQIETEHFVIGVSPNF